MLATGRQFQVVSGGINGGGHLLYQPIGAEAMMRMCEAYDGTMEDFEKMLLIEETYYPSLNKGS